MASTDNDYVALDPADVDDAPLGATAPEGAAAMIADGPSISRDAVQMVAIGAAARRMGVNVDVPAAVSRGLDPRALGLAVLDAAAARDESIAIISTAPTPASIGTAIDPAGRRESALLTEARRAAASTKK